MTEILNELKQAREAKGLTLQDISDKTRISTKYLAAIESGELGFLPEPYVRAFMKTFAREIGMDGDAVIRQWDELKRKKAVEVKEKETPQGQETVAPVRKKEKKPAKESRFKLGQHKSEVAVILLAMLVVAGIVYVYVRYHKGLFGGSNAEVKELPIEVAVAEAKKAAHLPEPVKPTPLHLELTARATTWVRVTVDDSTAEEYIFNEGDHKDWTAQERFRVRLGNAAGVDLQLNGKPLGELGASGQILDCRIGREGILGKQLVRSGAPPDSAATVQSQKNEVQQPQP